MFENFSLSLSPSLSLFLYLSLFSLSLYVWLHTPTDPLGCLDVLYALFSSQMH